MTLARVVTFEGVGADRIAEMRSRMEGEPPEGLPPSEIMLLYSEETGTATAIVLFDNEADYAAGDAVLDAMPTGDTPGRRTSVQKYELAVRRAR